MDTEIKEQLKISLLNEQSWVCGYCQQLIKDISKVKIEHHCEQRICNGENGYPDRRLDYTNLMAVCYGNFGSNDLHCDSNKARFNANNGLPIQVSPWNNAHMACIKYHSTGKVDSTNDIHSKEIAVFKQ